jgi:hypothetical protein
MADHRADLDRIMVAEGSRAIHEEFLLAEGGVLPDRRARMDRARSASARAWSRHLGRGLTGVWPGADPALASRIERWAAGHQERLEALALEEAAIAERRGASGDPEADRRDAALAAHCRLFAEALANAAELPGAGSPPDFSRRVGRAVRAAEARRRAIEAEARDAWSREAGPGPDQTTGAAPTPDADALRVAEAAAVWAHVQVLAEALEEALEGPPDGPDEPARIPIVPI